MYEREIIVKVFILACCVFFMLLKKKHLCYVRAINEKTRGKQMNIEDTKNKLRQVQKEKQMNLENMKNKLRQFQTCIDQIQDLVYLLEEKVMDEQDKRFTEKCAAFGIFRNPPRLETTNRCDDDYIAACGLTQSKLNS